MRLASLMTMFAVVMLPVAPALAQEKQSNREAFYRCRTASGQTLYGDSMPPGCSGVDTEVLSERGMVIRVIEGDRARASRAVREAVEGKLQRERTERQHKDRVLLETYLTVEDIERLRDQRLDLLNSQYRVTELNIKNLRERQTRLETQIARFKPYSDNAKAPPLPDHLAEEMVNTVNGMSVYQTTLQQNRKEQDDIRSSFGADIKRFSELKSR